MFDDLEDNIISELIDVISKNIDELKKEYINDISVSLLHNGCVLISTGDPEYENEITLKSMVKEYLENIDGVDSLKCFEGLAKCFELEAKRIRKHMSLIAMNVK